MAKKFSINDNEAVAETVEVAEPLDAAYKLVPENIDINNYKIAEVAHEIDKIDFNQITPIEALNTLAKIKEKLQ